LTGTAAGVGTPRTALTTANVFNGNDLILSKKRATRTPNNATKALAAVRVYQEPVNRSSA